MGRTAPPAPAVDPARARAGEADGSACPPGERERCLEQVRVAATVAERERLARELHDAPAQVLAAIHLRLRSLEGHPELAGLHAVQTELAEVAAVCADALRDLRQEIGGLRDCCAEDRSLPEVLGTLTARFARGTGIPTDLHVDPVGAEHLAPDAVVHVARIVAEALANVRKHAAARTVSVRVERHGAGVVASVEDDGVGFTQPPAPDGLRFGLHVMAERASLAGGHLDVGPRPGGGTRVRVVLPEPVPAPAGRRRAP